MSVIQPLVSLLQEKGGGRYDCEAVTQLQHALQAAYLAQQADAGHSQIVAALMHDIGHLRIDAKGLAEQGKDGRHEASGAALLRRYFGPSVTNPVRLHVDAKRYLCAVDPGYFATLSPASVASLKVQGGPYSTGDAEDFAAQPFAQEAVALRRWDDLAKVPDAPTPDLVHFAHLAEDLSELWLRGRLILVVGSSGAGKDSLIRAASKALADNSKIHFPKRAVTRQSDSEREDHESLTADAFRKIEAQGGFSLSWQAHGLSYGIPVAAEALLERGETVVVNASRTVVTAASRRYPNLEVVHVTASPEVLAKRLTARDGAETQDLEQRLARQVAWKEAGLKVHEIENDGSLAESLSKFVTIL